MSCGFTRNLTHGSQGKVFFFLFSLEKERKKERKKLPKYWLETGNLNKKRVSPAGNRTPVSRVTGGDTHHYTTEDSVMIEVKILQTAQLSTFSFSVFRACFVSFVVGLYEDFFWRPRDSIKKNKSGSAMRTYVDFHLLLITK